MNARMFVLCLVCSASGAAPAVKAAPVDPIGLWGAEKTYPGPPGGRLRIRGAAGGWVASLAGVETQLREEGGSLRGRFGAAELRVRLAAAGPGDGQWIQPRGTVVDVAYATPVNLARTADGGYEGEVTPLADQVRFYLSISRAPDGGLVAWVREPGSNAGRFLGNLTVAKDGDALTFRNARGEVALHGRLHESTLDLTLDAVGNLELALTRRGRDDAPGFYPRPSAEAQYHYRPPAAGRDG